MATDQDRLAQEAAAKAAADKKALTDKAELDRLAKEPAPKEPETKNLTRDSIEQTLKGKFMAEGKTDEEATKLAHKRAIEMVPDEPAKK